MQRGLAPTREPLTPMRRQRLAAFCPGNVQRDPPRRLGPQVQRRAQQLAPVALAVRPLRQPQAYRASRPGPWMIPPSGAPRPLPRAGSECSRSMPRCLQTAVIVARNHEPCFVEQAWPARDRQQAPVPGTVPGWAAALRRPAFPVRRRDWRWQSCPPPPPAAPADRAGRSPRGPTCAWIPSTSRAPLHRTLAAAARPSALMPQLSFARVPRAPSLPLRRPAADGRRARPA